MNIPDRIDPIGQEQRGKLAKTIHDLEDVLPRMRTCANEPQIQLHIRKLQPAFARARITPQYDMIQSPENWIRDGLDQLQTCVRLGSIEFLHMESIRCGLEELMACIYALFEHSNATGTLDNLHQRAQNGKLSRAQLLQFQKALYELLHLNNERYWF